MFSANERQNFVIATLLKVVDRVALASLSCTFRLLLTLVLGPLWLAVGFKLQQFQNIIRTVFVTQKKPIISQPDHVTSRPEEGPTNS